MPNVGAYEALPRTTCRYSTRAAAKRGRATPGRSRDDRPWGGTDPPTVVFHYAAGRGAEYPKAWLADYQGILQYNGYAAYKTLATAANGITLAFC